MVVNPSGSASSPPGQDPGDAAPAGSSLGVCPAMGVLAQGHDLPGAPLARRGDLAMLAQHGALGGQRLVGLVP